VKAAFRDADRIEDRLPHDPRLPDQTPAVRLEDVSQVAVGIDDGLHSEGLLSRCARPW
jgi:hypothetical protein